MKKLKHAKIKNTGILFELLVRQITADTLNGVSESKAAPIIRKYFSKKSELSKELELYQALTKEKFDSDVKSRKFFDAVMEARTKLNNSAIRRQKYNLIKEIKEAYVLEDFCKARINDYKALASIYKMFEYKISDNPAEMVKVESTLLEHISAVPASKKSEKTKIQEEYASQPEDIRLLSYKLLVDKFNDKYKGLSKPQKALLERYINNVSNTTTLKKHVNGEIDGLTKRLKEHRAKVTDKVTRIKLTEVVNLLGGLKKGKVVKDNEIQALLKYYELADQLDKVGSK